MNCLVVFAFLVWDVPDFAIWERCMVCCMVCKYSGGLKVRRTKNWLWNGFLTEFAHWKNCSVKRSSLVTILYEKSDMQLHKQDWNNVVCLTKDNAALSEGTLFRNHQARTLRKNQGRSWWKYTSTCYVGTLRQGSHFVKAFMDALVPGEGPREEGSWLLHKWTLFFCWFVKQLFWLMVNQNLLMFMCHAILKGQEGESRSQEQRKGERAPKGQTKVQ